MKEIIMSMRPFWIETHVEGRQTDIETDREVRQELLILLSDKELKVKVLRLLLFIAQMLQTLMETLF